MRGDESFEHDRWGRDTLQPPVGEKQREERPGFAIRALRCFRQFSEGFPEPPTAELRVAAECGRCELVTAKQQGATDRDIDARINSLKTRAVRTIEKGVRATGRHVAITAFVDENFVIDEEFALGMARNSFAGIVAFSS